MGKFACHCGYIISDSVCPCSYARELKWETETEDESQQRSNDIQNFITALKNEEDKYWVQNYFGDRYAEKYPAIITIGDVIEDIISRASDKRGRNVYQCPECERLYIQREFYTDDWVMCKKAG